MDKKEFAIKAKELVALKIEIATFEPIKKKYDKVKEEIKNYLIKNNKKSAKRTFNNIEWNFHLSQKGNPKLSIPERNIDKLEEILNENGLENLIPTVIITSRHVPEAQVEILKTALGESIEGLIEEKENTTRNFYLDKVE